MKVKYIRFPKRFSFTAINLFGCIFINSHYQQDLDERRSVYEKLIRHESIHSAQGKELLWVFFYLLYVLEWFVRLIQYRKAKTKDGKKDFNAAYRNISFEREAYANENDVFYLKNRKRFSAFRYIRL
jgi:beta-lactamase regulating signal transducer with metallopeptidase domain